MPKAHTPALPTSPPAFRRLVAAAKTVETREELAESIEREFRQAGGRPMQGRTGQPPVAVRRFEDRMLEFLRTPRERTDLDDLFGPGLRELESSQEYAWRQLVNLRSERFARWLRTLSRSRDAFLRAEAAQHLAWIGFDRDVPQVCRWAAGKDLKLLDGVAQGGGLAAFHEHASRKYRARLFEALAPLLEGSRDVGASEAARQLIHVIAETLLQLDAPRAVALMTSPACLRPGNRWVAAVLLSLHLKRDEIPKRPALSIDPDLLWPLYARRKASAGIILVFTADLDPMRTRRECREVIKAAGKEWSSLKDQAQEALRRCKRVPQPEPALTWMERHPGKLPRHAEQVLRAYELASHVLTDGFPLYFHNVGQHWKAALAGLQTLRLDGPAKALRNGARVFGAQGPPAAERQRQAAFHSLSPAQQKKLDALGDSFDRLVPSIIGGVERYMSRNAGVFGRAHR